ncbi:LuxR C-terminal-related transcriptional regulator [Streptomyces sp. NBC_00249]|uniref:helix-turn-helix transcriptional regulator n=1 Tax=Streptomyces sp. NBC_00249 TaxID=2975690 RepID=UPI002256C653|nr:LuxR family transcriptional regulator [Streptomyces sp. NBC_00249]MCX5192875.1 LuxR C-terminal-related transcriptional regulator [Streptomyces sp. NBC_00249]
MFAGLGLEGKAEAVYWEMLKHPEADVEQVAERLGLGTQEIRDCLDELGRLLLIRPSWDAPGEVRAVDPEVGLASLLARQEADLLREQERISANRTALQQVIAEFQHTKQGRHDPDVERLTNIDSIRFKIEALAAKCSSEILGFVPAGAQSAANLEASRPLDSAVLDRNVRMRTIYLESIVNDRPTMDYARWLVESGAEVRTAAVLPPRMVIYDRKTAIVPLDPETTRAGAMLLHSTGVVSALCDLFEQVWKASMPLDAAVAEQEEELTAQEAAILQLLADGHTDDTIARKLGVSVRTSRRITAKLTAQLGAKSRFQAGVLATSRGWVR